MDEILGYLTNANLLELAKDARILVGAGALLVLALIFRWKYIAALLLGMGGTLAVIHYANLGQGNAAIDRDLLTFGIGAVIVAGIVIYFLFIRSD
ncbi:MAG: hypothetical protein AB1346_12850 [Thermodesulfobacteriota bacterium]